MRITARASSSSVSRASSSSVTPHSASSYPTLVTTTTHTTRATALPATAYYSQASASPPYPPATRLESESRDQAAGGGIATEWSPWEVLAVMDAMGEVLSLLALLVQKYKY